MKSHNFLKRKSLEILKVNKFFRIFFFLNLILVFFISILLMPHKQLFEFENDQLVAYNECGLSFYDITKKLNCHHSSIDIFLKKYKNIESYYVLDQ